MSPRSGEKLKRSISLPLLTFYGIGTILGAGIYVLVGKVAGASGMLAPLAFLVAAIVAGITALSYCQLVVNFPRSAGEAYYVEEGFKSRALSIAMGYLVIFTGIVSAATLANGFVGYTASFFAISRPVGITVVVGGMGLVAIWGIAESLWLAAIITLVEVGGLVVIVALGGEVLLDAPSKITEMMVPVSITELSMVLSGAFLAFYAFVGFEDMVNIVEEVKNPKKTMPRAIVIALVLATFLYVLVAMVAILGMPLDELSNSGAPLKELLQKDHAAVGMWIGIISIFAIINGLLTQIIMASRVMFGMADQGRAPAFFSIVWPKTKTPWLATLLILLIIWGAALWLPLVALAKTTSFIILTVFMFVNLALFKLQRAGKIIIRPNLPAWPLIGAILCSGLLLFQISQIIN